MKGLYNNTVVKQDAMKYTKFSINSGLSRGCRLQAAEYHCKGDVTVLENSAHFLCNNQHASDF